MKIVKLLLICVVLSFLFVEPNFTLSAEEDISFSPKDIDSNENYGEILNSSIEPLMGSERFLFDARFVVDRWWVVPKTFTTRNPGLQVYATNNRDTTYEIGVATFSASSGSWGVSYNMWQTFGSGYHIKYYSGLKAGTNYRLVVKGSGSGTLGAVDWGPN